MTLCKRCILDDIDPGISLDQNGICNYCHWQDGMEAKHKIIPGREHDELMENKYQGYRGKYDCIIGISGGVDSSYLLTKVVQDWNLKPLAVTFDDGWNTKTAQDNIRKLVDKLDVDLYTYVVDYEEMNDIYRSFLLAGVPDTDAPTDIAIAKVLRMAAKEHGVKTVFDAHNFRTEGTTPLGWLYFDGKYIESVHDKYGKLAWSKPGKNGGGFPNLSMYGMLTSRLNMIRPLYNMEYSREGAKEYLQKKVGYEVYDLHHGENIWTKFSNYVWMPDEFGLDLRRVFLSAQVRSGIITRLQALWKGYSKPLQDIERNRLVKDVEERLDITTGLVSKWIRVEDIEQINRKRTYNDFATYRQQFKQYKPIFWAMMKMGLVQENFYNKYCKGV